MQLTKYLKKMKFPIFFHIRNLPLKKGFNVRGCRCLTSRLCTINFYFEILSKQHRSYAAIEALRKRLGEIPLVSDTGIKRKKPTATAR
jgi:hypothetical protein